MNHVINIAYDQHVTEVMGKQGWVSTLIPMKGWWVNDLNLPMCRSL